MVNIPAVPSEGPDLGVASIIL